MEFKLTPLLLFFIILLVLVVSIIFMNNVKYEGFIDFYSNTSPTNAGSVIIPLYSTHYSLAKLYDNLYVDKRNANLIALNGPSTGTPSTEPTTLTTINVLRRTNNANNNFVTYTNSQSISSSYDSSESKDTAITTNYQMYTMQTAPPSAYEVLYFGWDKDTFLHVINIASSAYKHLISVYIDNNANISSYDMSLNRNIHEYPGLNATSLVSDVSDNKQKTLDVYGSATVYQLHTNVYYDNLRGFVICMGTKSDNTFGIIYIYDYMGVDVYNKAKDTTNPDYNNNPGTSQRIAALIAKGSFASVDTFTSAVVNGTNKNGAGTAIVNEKTVLILSIKQKKLLVHFSNNTSNTVPIVTNYFKFNGSILETTQTPPPQSNKDDKKGTDTQSSALDSSKVYDEYMKWYTYWNSVGQPGNKGFSDDYLLKTQIVPPVCPACNSVGGCSNCNAGGSSVSNTGSGTGGTSAAASTTPGSTTPGSGTVIAKTDGKSESVLATTGKQITTVDRGGALASTADPDTLGGSLTLGQLSFVAGLQDVGHVIGDTADNAVNKVGQGIGAVGQGIGSAGSGIYNTVNAAGQGVYSAGAGIGGAIKDTGSYLGGAINKVGNTAYDAGKYVGTGIGNELSDNGKRYTGGGNALSDRGDSRVNNGNINGAGYKDNYYDPSRQAYSNSYRGATTNAPGQYTGTNIDGYSYYGALQSKGGNFMPLTSDFSKFGR